MPDQDLLDRLARQMNVEAVNLESAGSGAARIARGHLDRMLEATRSAALKGELSAADLRTLRGRLRGIASECAWDLGGAGNKESWAYDRIVEALRSADRVTAPLVDLESRTTIPEQIVKTVSKEERPDLNAKERQRLARERYLNSLTPEQRRALDRGMEVLQAQSRANEEARWQKETTERQAWPGNEKVAAEVERELKRRGLTYTKHVAGTGSTYYDVEGVGTIRVSDHASPPGGGFNVERGERSYGNAEWDITPHSKIGPRGAVRAAAIEAGQDVPPSAVLSGEILTRPDPIALARAFDRLEGAFKGSSADMARAVEKQLVAAVTGGREPAEIARQLVTANVVDPVGNMTPPARAEVIARTETMRVYRQAVRQKAEGAGLRHYRMVGPVDGRTSKLCRSLVGRTMAAEEWKAILGDRWEGGEHEGRGLHPNCRHSFQPLEPRWVGLQEGDVSRTFGAQSEVIQAHDADASLPAYGVKELLSMPAEERAALMADSSRGFRLRGAA